MKKGIDVVQGYKINVVRGSENIIDEITNYVWQEDKNDEFINKPIDKFNHALDALRYVCIMKVHNDSPRRTSVRKMKKY